MTERQERSIGGDVGVPVACSQGLACQSKALRVTEVVAFHEAAGKATLAVRIWSSMDWTRTATERQRRATRVTDGPTKSGSRSRWRTEAHRDGVNRAMDRCLDRSEPSVGCDRHRMRGCSSLTIRVCTCQPDASSGLEAGGNAALEFGCSVSGAMLLLQCRESIRVQRCWRVRAAANHGAPIRDDPG